jgi:3-isopropylmalate dehydrogenase
MQLVLNPNQYDVIVSSNLFGDILSDIAATLSGSIGMLPSASLNSSGQGMYEPCHGSAPDIAGQDIANPIGMISSLAMAFEYSLERKDLAQKIKSAIKIFINQGNRTKDIATSEEFIRTSEVAPTLIEIIQNEQKN